MLFGFLAYTAYLRFLSPNDITATGIGWVFFVPQYLVLWLGTWANSPAATITLSAYGLIGLYYGYAFLSFRLAPGLWRSVFITSGVLFLLVAHWQHAVTGGWIMMLTCLFWQAEAMRDVLYDFGFSNHIVRLFIESLSVGFFYATLITSVRGFFLLINPRKSTRPAVQDSTEVINCPGCHQSLRIRSASHGAGFRCPVCKTIIPEPSAV